MNYIKYLLKMARIFICKHDYKCIGWREQEDNKTVSLWVCMRCGKTARHSVDWSN